MLLLHPQSGLLCGAALPRVLFIQKNNTFAKKHVLYDFQMVFVQNGSNLLLTRGTTIKTGILTLIEFWWVPEILEMVVPESAPLSKESSQNQPA